MSTLRRKGLNMIMPSLDAGSTPIQPLALSMDDIEALDLSMIKLKLRDLEEGPGWDADTCNTVEVEYKRFLSLKRAYPEYELVPDRQVDLFWHQHILDTEKYALDCAVIFGSFLHHFPYFGMRSQEDYAALCRAFSESQSLYELHFGSSSNEFPRSTKCRTKCKPVRCK
jgi:hypothetical protein